MKTCISSQRNQALTRIDVVVAVIVAIFLCAFLFAVFLPMKAISIRHVPRIQCVNNLKRTAIAARIWEGDQGNWYPMSVSVTNGGGMEWIANADLADFFRGMSNELITTKILVCPADHDHKPATDFGEGFDNSHISYFVNADASETYPQQIFMGDSNLMTNGVPLKPGIVDLPGNGPISWTKARHRFVGNISFADGSVAEESALGLENALVCSTNGTPFAYNRYVIP